MSLLSRLAPNDEEFENVLKTMNKPVGSMHYDPWGFNKDTNHAAVALFKWMYETYFRVEATGLENIPAEGRCLLIGNHSGQLPIDAMLLGYAVATNPHAPRTPRAMIERFFPSVPFLGNFMNRIGAVVGDPINCRKLLENEEAILVFPEGARGAGKPFSKRYELQRFGTGFMHLAMEHQAPVVPVGIVGCEESVPTPAHQGAAAKQPEGLTTAIAAAHGQLLTAGIQVLKPGMLAPGRGDGKVIFLALVGERNDGTRVRGARVLQMGAT